MNKTRLLAGGVAAVAVCGLSAVALGATASAATKTPTPVTRTYWQSDDGVGAVVTTTMPDDHTVVVNGSSFAGSKPGPNSFAAYLQAGAAQWIYGPDKAFVPPGYPNSPVPSTSGLKLIWAGNVDGYPVKLYTNLGNPYSAGTALEAWLKA